MNTQHVQDSLFQFSVIFRMGKNVKLSTTQSIVAGSVAGLVSGFSFQPLEVLRTRAIGIEI